MFENGLQDQFILDMWECKWAEHARDSAKRDDKDAVIRAGENMVKRIDIPGQREMNLDWDQTVEGIYSYLLVGDYETRSDYWEFSCFDDGEEVGDEIEWMTP